MASDALFEELVKALSRPSKAYRAVKAGFDVPGQALEGYSKGAEFREKFDERRLGNQTLNEVLGGTPPGLEGYGGMTVNAAKRISGPIEAIASLKKATAPPDEKQPDFYSPEQAEAVASGDPKKIAAAFGGKVPSRAVSQGLTQNRFGKSMDFRGDTRVLGEAAKFKKDIEKPLSSRTDAVQAIGLIQRGTPLGDAALRRLIPRAMREVGNLSEYEQKIGLVSPDVVNKAQSLFSKYTSGLELTESDRADLMGVLAEFKKLSEARIKSTHDYYADRLSQNFGMPYDMAVERLGSLDRLYGPDDFSNAKPAQKVRVSNGRETLEIDPVDVPEAAKDGYRPI